MEQLELVLQDLGLSKKESKIYLSNLKLGEQTASRISQLANLNRVTTYEILKSLAEKGYISINLKNKVRVFKATPPKSILSLLETKKTKFKSVLPQLNKLRQVVDTKSHVEQFEGKDGISSMLGTLLENANSNKKVYAYGNLSIGEKIIKYQSLKWRKERINNKIHMLAIVNSIKDFKKDSIIMKDWSELTTVRTLKSLSELDSYTLITKDYVAHLTFKGELQAILIKNPEIVKIQMQFHKFLFEKSHSKSL